jgi:hypothetical protein
MLSHSPFYHSHLRKIVHAFGTLFNDIEIQRKDDNGNVIQTIKVPFSYAPKELWVTRLQQDPNPEDPERANHLQVVLPRMAYEMKTMKYDNSRKLQSVGQNVQVKTGDETILLTQFNPVPWNIDFSVYVMSRNIDDSLQIIEQVLPFFEPDFSITIQEMPEMNILRDVPVVFQGIDSDIVYEGGLDKTRVGIWTLNFVAKASLYQPIRNVKVIRDSTTNIIVETTDQTRGGKAIINVTPEPIDAMPDDNWTYNTTITEEP